MPSFRMHLRARGKVAQVFKILSDAPQHPVSETLFIFLPFLRNCCFLLLILSLVEMMQGCIQKVGIKVFLSSLNQEL